jgi:hypothetical protein
MTDERESPQGPVGQPPNASADDDEPTLETLKPAEDDEPTLETMAQGVAGDRAQETAAPEAVPDNTMEIVTPKVTGWASRLEQLTAAKQERRRRVVARFWLAAAPMLILLAIAVVLLAVYGGQSSGGSAVSTTTTAARHQVEGSGLLLIAKADKLLWAVVLEPWDSGGVVLGVPGITLLESEGAFRTLSEVYAGGRAVSVEAALAEVLDVSVGPVVVADWSALQAVAQTAGVQGLSEEYVSVGQGETDPLTTAVRTLVGQYDSTAGNGPWTEMGLNGETAEFLRILGVDQASMAKDVWTTASLAGTVVNGDGFTYLEPDAAQAKSLLAVTEEVTTVSVEIRDGAGLEGAARRAGSLIESGGFVLAPMGYAEGYPSVEKTRILASSEVLEKARQVQALLGVGEVVEDETVLADHIIVTLGKDFGGASG